MNLSDEGAIIRFLIRDRDARLSRSFDDVFASEGIRVIHTRIRAPNANAFAERWIETLRAECLDPLLILGPYAASINSDLFGGNMAALPTMIKENFGLPDQPAVDRMWASALTLILIVLLLNLVGRFVARFSGVRR